MKILLLLAHADDECLGAGGTIPYLLAKRHEVSLMVVSEGIVRFRSTQDDNRFALGEACSVLGIEKYQRLGFPDQAFETVPTASIANEVQAKWDGIPDLIITHSSHDLNQDHRIVHEVAKIVGRPRKKPISILGCEIPASARWNSQDFEAQFYVDISLYLEQKIKAFSCYTSENKEFPDPFSSEGLRTMAKFRGMECGTIAAEAFEVIRWQGIF